MLTPSSRHHLRHHHRHLLCRRLRLPLPLLPRLALIEQEHRQLPSDQKGLSRGILNAFCSCPHRTPRRLWPAGTLSARLGQPFERKGGVDP